MSTNLQASFSENVLLFKNNPSKRSLSFFRASCILEIFQTKTPKIGWTWLIVVKSLCRLLFAYLPGYLTHQIFLQRISTKIKIYRLCQKDTETKTNIYDCRMMGKLIEFRIVKVTIIVISWYEVAIDLWYAIKKCLTSNSKFVLNLKIIYFLDCIRLWQICTRSCGKVCTFGKS